MTASDFHMDRSLFKQISAGNEKAFRAIFDLYKVDLYRLVFKLTKSHIIAEEVIQELKPGNTSLYETPLQLKGCFYLPLLVGQLFLN